MFVDEEDDFGGVGGVLGASFANLERKAAENTGRMMENVQSQLYDTQIIITPPAAPPMSIDEDDDGGFPGVGHFRRFADNEYEAHTDTVKLEELRDWQEPFPYLRVLGGAAGASAGVPSTGKQESHDIDGFNLSQHQIA